MAYLYLLSESDNDDAFFKACVERLTGKTVELVSRRLRRGGGLSELRSKSRILLGQIKHTGYVEETFFLIALDNDRNPVHTTHERRSGLSRKEKQKTCRFCEIDEVIQSFLGERHEWSIQGAIAVPVEMLESWLLLICDGEKHRDEASLPPFARQDQKLARDFYASKRPPDQLKDLCDFEKQERCIDATLEFVAYCAGRLDPDDLAARAASFALFKRQVDSW